MLHRGAAVTLCWKGCKSGHLQGMPCPESCDTLENQLLRSQRMAKPDTRRTARCASGAVEQGHLAVAACYCSSSWKESGLRGQAHSLWCVSASVYQKTALKEAIQPTFVPYATCSLLVLHVNQQEVNNFKPTGQGGRGGVSFNKKGRGGGHGQTDLVSFRDDQS